LLLSVYDISQALKKRQIRLSATAVREILKEPLWGFREADLRACLVETGTLAGTGRSRHS
jgi:hypothetical protein